MHHVPVYNILETLDPRKLFSNPRKLCAAKIWTYTVLGYSWPDLTMRMDACMYQKCVQTMALVQLIVENLLTLCKH